MSVPPIVHDLRRLRDVLAARAAQLAQHLAEVQEQDARHAELRKMHDEAQEKARQMVAQADAENERLRRLLDGKG